MAAIDEQARPASPWTRRLLTGIVPPRSPEDHNTRWTKSSTPPASPSRSAGAVRTYGDAIDYAERGLAGAGSSAAAMPLKNKASFVSLSYTDCKPGEAPKLIQSSTAVASPADNKENTRPAPAASTTVRASAFQQSGRASPVPGSAPTFEPTPRTAVIAQAKDAFAAGSASQARPLPPSQPVFKPTPRPLSTHGYPLQSALKPTQRQPSVPFPAQRIASQPLTPPITTRPATVAAPTVPSSSTRPAIPAPMRPPVTPLPDQPSSSYQARPLAKSVGPGSGRIGGPSLAPKPAPAPAVETRVQRVEREFAALLDRMQVDAALRTKMRATELTVKEAMLKSAAEHRAAETVVEPETVSSGTGTGIFGRLRKSRSTQSLRSVASESSEPAAGTTSRPLFGRIRSSSVSSTKSAKGCASTDPTLPAPTAEAWSHHLRTSSLADLQPSALIKLRVLLRQESPEWIRDFVRFGGLRGLIERLGDLLALEWREEQRDDALLFEMLKGLKAIQQTEAGRSAIASLCPTPHRALVDLLFGEKKPGDLPARQVIVELVQGLFECFGPACPPTKAMVDAVGEGWGKPLPSLVSTDQPASPIEPPSRRPTTASNATTHALVAALMVGPPNAAEESLVGFIRSAHRSRPYKQWMTELTSILSDHFWIFCHGTNTFWVLDQLDQNVLEAPKVPGGQTAGIEYIAMECATAHLRLVNALARSAPSTRDERALHADLFASGFERVILASIRFYPQLHLELARYIGQARDCGFGLGANVLRYFDAAIGKTPPTWARPQHARSRTEASVPSAAYLPPLALGGGPLA